MKVLIAEDDTNIRNGLVEILVGEGYDVVSAANGAEALALFERERPDFVCLDIMMPGKSGYDVCKAIRAVSEEIPIIFISAKSEEVDKVLGLELGADDYILKPFGVREVVARIRSVTRRTYRARSSETESPFVIGDLKVSPSELRAERAGEPPLDLSLREVKLLRLFAQNVGKVLDRNVLLDECWGTKYMPSSRTLDQTIATLRKKIERDPKEPSIIRTVYGVGYRYEG